MMFYMGYFTAKDLEELCTVQQVTKLVGVTRQAVHLAIKKGKLRVKYLGHHPYPHREDVELWMQNREGKSRGARTGQQTDD